MAPNPKTDTPTHIMMANPCPTCAGSARVLTPNGNGKNTVPCFDCAGLGYYKQIILIADAKKILGM